MTEGHLEEARDASRTQPTNPLPVKFHRTTASGLCEARQPFRQEVKMHLSKVKDFLDTYGVKYVVISHSKAYTAQGIAAVSHIRAKSWPRPSL